jgi:geranylgeranyl pyrophosphate synthase
MIDVTHRGQYLDMHLTHDVRDITKFTQEDYYKSIHAKSAYYSVYGPMQQGAIIAGAGGKEVEGIADYGTPTGNAFQIKDDILDCTSSEDKLGKSIGNDVRDGVKTLILWHAVSKASQPTLNRMKRIYNKRREDKTEEEVRFVLDSFNELGSIRFAEQEAERLSKLGIERFNALTKQIKESGLKDLARDSIGYTVKRGN